MKILFMCVANSARSQLAEGLAKEIFGNRAEIRSAGSKPSRVNPFAIKAMAEVGIDITTQSSKVFSDLPLDFRNSLDYVITLCADEVCPVVVSTAKRLHWPLPDPAGEGDENEQILRFRNVRDELKKLVVEFSLLNK